MDNSLITVSKISDFLGIKYIGKDFIINKVCSINFPVENAVGFIQKKHTRELSSFSVLWLTGDEPLLPDFFLGAYITVRNPKLAYARIVQEFFAQKPMEQSIAKSAKIGKNVKIGERVSIGEWAVIGDNVEIKSDTIINHHVVIMANTVIGKFCYIKSGAVIGEEGFGLVLDKKRPVRIPHMGKVIIGNHVEVGVNSVIARGTIDNTIIHDYVKIDDHVLVAHNCEIGENTQIAGFSSLGGSVKIDKNCCIAPHTSMLQKIEIEEGSVVGIGTVVLERVKKGSKIMDIRRKLDLNAISQMKSEENADRNNNGALKKLSCDDR